MRVHILKPFPFSRDGITPLRAVAGSIDDIPDALVPGLRAGGFIGVSAPEDKGPLRERAIAAPPAERQVMEPKVERSASGDVKIGEGGYPPAALAERDDKPQRDRRHPHRK